MKNEAILWDVLQKWKVECRADGLVPMCFAIFPAHLSKLLRLPRKSHARSYEVLHLSRKIISANLKILGSKMQPLSGNQRPDLLTDSDEHVSCTAPATENASLQILFKCPTPAIAFGNATKPSRFAHFWQSAQSLALATRNDIWTSKSGPKPWSFHILTSKCALRHNRVHFFHISTSKSGPNMVFCPFWLRNMLRATFSTSQLPKVVRTWCFVTFLPFRTPASSFFWLFLFSDLLFAALLFSSLTLTTSAVHLPILSEVWLPNFLRQSSAGKCFVQAL